MSASSESEEILMLVQDLRKFRLADDDDLENCMETRVDLHRIRPPIHIKGDIPGAELETKPPQVDDPFPGCPFLSAYDNSVQRILAHSCHGRAKFCVVFKFFRFFKWLDALVVMKLEPKVVLSDYLILLQRRDIVRFRELLVRAPAIARSIMRDTVEEATRISPHSQFFHPISPVFPLKVKPYYGCPGNTLKENRMLCILEHGYYNRQVKFCVAFKNYGFWNWIHGFIVWRMKPRYVLKEYLRRLRVENQFRYNILITKMADSEELADEFWRNFMDEDK